MKLRLNKNAILLDSVFFILLRTTAYWFPRFRVVMQTVLPAPDVLTQAHGNEKDGVEHGKHLLKTLIQHQWEFLLVQQNLPGPQGHPALWQTDANDRGHRLQLL